MPVRGRNMAPGARIQAIMLGGNTTAQNDGSAARLTQITVALRTSIQIQELGVTIARGSLNSTITDNAADLKFYIMNKGVATAIASLSVAAKTAVGSEFTSRDATITWIGDYQNAASRVFPKGSYLGVEFDSAGDGNTGNGADYFMCYAFAPEFGAEPA